MAFTDQGDLGHANSSTSSTTVALTTTADAPVGRLIVVMSAWDNTDISDIDGNRHRVTDSAGNFYRYLGQWVNAQGAAAAGAEAMIFATVVETDLPSGGTITVTSGTARVAKAVTARQFSLDSPSFCLSGKAELSTDAADPGSLSLSGLDSREYLFLHCLAGEGPNSDAYTWDSDYTQLAGDGTSLATAASNMHVRGGFRIATLTGDTVDVTETTAARDYAQVFVAIREYDPGDPPNPTLNDDFNRANETPLAAPWTGIGSNQMRLASNQAIPASSTVPSASGKPGFVGDLEAAADIATMPSSGNVVGVAAHMATGWTGYVVTTNGVGQIALWSQSGTTLATQTAPKLAFQYVTLTAGDTLSVRVQDTVVEAWFRQSGNWRLFAAVDDTTWRTGVAGVAATQTGALDNFSADSIEHVPFIASVTAVYTPALVGIEAVPFISSVTAVYAPTLVPISASEVDVPFIASHTHVWAIFSLFDPNRTYGGPGNGGESFAVRLAPNGGGSSATLDLDIAASASELHLSGDSGLPTSEPFVVTIDSEVIYVRRLAPGVYRIILRGLSNTVAASHTAGATVTWGDSYDLELTATSDIAHNFTADILGSGSTTYPGWLICFDSTQAYLSGSRYPMHITSVLGVFDAGAGSSGSNRCDAAQPNAISTPTGASDDCPAALSNPSRISSDIATGDVALVRYTNPEATVLDLGPRSVALQSWFGLKRVSTVDADVTFTDPNGIVVDTTGTYDTFTGSVNGEWANPIPLVTGIAPDASDAASSAIDTPNPVPWTTVTLPGTDRYFTYGSAGGGYDEKGWPMCCLAVRQGNRRIPHWQSWDWKDYAYVYDGFGTDSTFCQILINRNGIVFSSVPAVELPGPQNIDGPDAVWDDRTYDYGASWYVVIFNTPYLVYGPSIGGTVVTGDGSGGGGSGGGSAPGVNFPPGGSPIITPPPIVEGGGGGGINPPQAGLHVWQTS